jgi:type IV secretory pathway TrbL component
MKLDKRHIRCDAGVLLVVSKAALHPITVPVLVSLLLHLLLLLLAVVAVPDTPEVVAGVAAAAGGGAVGDVASFRAGTSLVGHAAATATAWLTCSSWNAACACSRVSHGRICSAGCKEFAGACQLEGA